jgi:DnaK suppressor protein
MRAKQRAVKQASPKNGGLKASEIAELRVMLERMLETISGQVQTLKSDAVQDSESSNPEEDGTDAFDREFALQMAGARQESIRKVEAAIGRINEGTYGTCEVCSGHIGAERMKALPFVMTCIACQSEAEKGRAPRARIPG